MARRAASGGVGFTRLSEANQHACWANSNASCGLAPMHLYRDWGGNKRDKHLSGIRVLGQNPQLQDVLADADYYVDVQHSHGYVLATWQVYFDVLAIIPAPGAGAGRRGPQGAAGLRRCIQKLPPAPSPGQRGNTELTASGWRVNM